MGVSGSTVGTMLVRAVLNKLRIVLPGDRPRCNVVNEHHDAACVRHSGHGGKHRDAFGVPFG